MFCVLKKRLQDFKTSRRKTNLQLNLRNQRAKYSFVPNKLGSVHPDSHRDCLWTFHNFCI